MFPRVIYKCTIIEADLGDYLEELGIGLADLLQHGGEHVGVLLDDRSDLLEHLVIPVNKTSFLRCYANCLFSLNFANQALLYVQ